MEISNELKIDYIEGRLVDAYRMIDDIREEIREIKKYVKKEI